MNIRTIQWKEALPIRHKVLWPDKPISFCKIDGDEEAKHYGVYIADKLVCVASIYIKGKTARLRKFATLVEFQGNGLGTKLITYIIDELKNMDIECFWCNARKTASSFYRKFDMLQEGDEFVKSGVLYIKMKIKLV